MTPHSTPLQTDRRALLGLLAAAPSAWLWPSPATAQPAGSNEAQALHLINRLSLGPAPGELARVARMGAAAYLAEQLAPERLPLPAALQSRLDGLDTLKMSARELGRKFRESFKETRRNRQAGDDQDNPKRELFNRVLEQAGTARLARALLSPRQLEELMVDFWFNHFNVYSGKGLTGILIGLYERDAIRPHAMGRFRDLLGATAHHPAMLFYLDNWLSVGTSAGQPAAGGGAKKPSSGLNENYARELMELHTLGVDGGYSQADVTTLARMFTGWTIDQQGRAESLFLFDDARHDAGRKVWLGQPVERQGQAEGEWALDRLASHPATARHVCTRLAQYFLADAPSPALVASLAQRFLASEGDIRSVLRTLFDSEEFRQPAQFGRKFKTPYRYVLSCLRLAELMPPQPRLVMGALKQLGMPLYGCPTPDGYKQQESAWLNPEALSRRVSVATAIAAGRMPSAKPAEGEGEAMSMPARATRPEARAGGVRPADVRQLRAALGPGLSASTQQAIEEAQPALQAALVLGSPDFMRH